MKLKVGIAVRCAVCGLIKKPIGRAASLGAYGCDEECQGYRQPPFVGSLWPGETEEDFGYPVGDDGTELVEGDNRRTKQPRQQTR